MGDAQAIDRLCRYLQIKTVQPRPCYEESTRFLTELAREAGLDVRVFSPAEGKPIVVMSVKGSAPEEPAILLNSHTDVVPVTESKWTHPPFGAHIVEGKIYARGSQDMKSVGLGYFEAVCRLRAKGHMFRRTVHLSYVPDEEIGGKEGMGRFVKTDEFAALNVGFVLDEGVPSPQPSLLLFNGERAPWWIRIRTTGTAGHGSALLQGTAMERLLRILGRVQQFRDDQVARLTRSDNVLRDCGKFTSVNITMLSAGKQVNVIPDEAIAHLDIRIAKDLGMERVESLLDEWTLGTDGVDVCVESYNQLLPDTSVATDDPWWSAIANVLNKRDLSYDVSTFPGATDSRFIREMGIPAIGISPFRNTPLLLHDHDEHLGCSEYLEGVSIYEDLIQALSSQV